MDQVSAYERLNRRFIDLAEAQGQEIRPALGRSRDLENSPVYFEIAGERWLSIYDEQGQLDPQWNGQVNPAHMQVFADLNVHDIDLLWRVRCAWMNFPADLDRAEKDVFAILQSAGLPDPRP